MLSSKQFTSAIVVPVDNTKGCCTVAESLIEQPSESVIITEYNPEGTLEIFCVMAPVFHKKVKGALPVGVVDTVPVLSLLQRVSEAIMPMPVIPLTVK